MTTPRDDGGLLSPDAQPRPWDAQIDIDAGHARRLIHARFPDIAVSTITPFGRGWDNSAFLVDDAIVFRFPRKASAAPLLEIEARALPVIAPRVPLAVPVPEWVGNAGDDFPWPFTGYRLVPGRTACHADLGEAHRRRAAPLLGDFLARLHAIPTSSVDVPGDTLARTDFTTRLPLIVERLDVLHARGIVDDPSPWLRLFDALDSPPEPPGRATLVHGDLYVRHLIVDEDRNLTGVIDWGDVHAGDPAVDLMLLFGFLPAAARPDFIAAYGEVDARTLRLARLRAAFHAVSIGWYGIELGDEALTREARAALRFVVE